MNLFKTCSLTVIATLTLAGCAFTSVTPGMSQQEVIARNGAPTRVLPVGNGTRLQYSGQPLGRWAFMVDLDASGRVVSSRQVLDPREFAAIVTGQWTRGDMAREFGRPASMDHVASWAGDIMTYRWRDGIQNMFFWAYLDGANVVQRTGQAMEIPFEMRDK